MLPRICWGYCGFDTQYHTLIDTADNSLTEQNDHNLPVFSVGELSSAVRSTVESAFRRVRVRGELSGFKRAASGHLYFSLKDDNAVLDGVCWRGTAGKLSVQPEDGMEVVATGRVTTYAGRSKYQIIVESLEPAGEGALLKLLRDRQRRLREEGLFDEDRKRAIPFLPTTIGVITSPTGAVFRDILHRLNDRFPRHVVIWPVLVQGDGAAGQITNAVRGFNALPGDGAVARPDVLIVARGGGSLEDLWSFNEENVVRAVAESTIPVISAVGHETDTTLIDFASDIRAPTPTAAAEMAVPVRIDLIGQVLDFSRRMSGGIARQLEEGRVHVQGLGRGLPNLRRFVDEASQRLDEWDERLGLSLGGGLSSRANRIAVLAAELRHPEPLLRRGAANLAATAKGLNRAMRQFLRDRDSGLGHAGSLLESYSYRRTLDRGFTLVTEPDGKPVRAAVAVSSGMALAIEFHDGRVSATATGADSDKPATARPVPDQTPPAKSKKNGERDPRQATLL